MNKMIAFKIIFLVLIISVFIQSEQVIAQIDHSIAQKYFNEIENLLGNDGGKLWGMRLDGPAMIVDPASRTLVANQSDRLGNLTRHGRVYTGSLPDNIPLANTVVDWGGVRWAMILTPVPSEAYTRTSLFIHELWHLKQNELGFPVTSPSNNHLDTRDGRIYIQLELRALLQALNSTGNQRREAIRDALLFRAYRHSLFPRAAEEERQLENHEGLAEYTGITIAVRSDGDKRRLMIDNLRQSERLPGYTRAFAYFTTPAYGILLDAVATGWLRTFTHRDHLPEAVRTRYGIHLPARLADEARRRMNQYDGEAVIAAETRIEIEKKKEIENFKRRFITGPRLVIPLFERRISFDPRDVTPLEGHGKIYKTLTVTDVWGTLEATDSALMGDDWNNVYIDAPDLTQGRRIEGKGYTLELRDGWRVVRDTRNGDYVITRLE